MTSSEHSHPDDEAERYSLDEAWRFQDDMEPIMTYVHVEQVEDMIKGWQAECAGHPAIYNQGNVLRDRLDKLTADIETPVDWMDVSAWSVFEGHAMPVHVAEYIAGKINALLAAQRQDPPMTASEHTELLPDRLTIEELRGLFGDSIPMEAARLIWPEHFLEPGGVPHYDPIDVLREKLRELAPDGAEPVPVAWPGRRGGTRRPSAPERSPIDLLIDAVEAAGCSVAHAPGGFVVHCAELKSRATAAEGRVALLEEERDDEDWRDMSTAPRDGTHILVRFGRADDVTPPTVAHWFGTPEDGSWYLSVQQHEGPPICPAFWRLIPAFCEGGQ